MAQKSKLKGEIKIRTIDVITGQLKKLKQKDDVYVACCPAHQDHNPSFFIKECEDGTILLHCFAGCGLKEICDSLGVEVKDLFPARKQLTPEKKHKQSEAQHTRELHEKFETHINQAFLAMADFRSNTSSMIEKYKLDIPPTKVNGVHELPKVEYYMGIIAEGTNEEKLELLREGVITKWAKQYLINRTCSW